MSDETTLQVLKQVSQIAALAGLKGQVERGQHFRMGFGLDDNRSQMVFVRPTAQTPAGKQVVTFFSPCLVVPKGPLAGFSGDRAIDLLRRNEKVLFARFGIWEDDEQSMVVASVDHILETLDAEEFSTTAWYVALAADRYEREHGRDSF